MAHRVHSGLGKYTHAFPGEHFIIVRPLRDDVRRSSVEAPRRSRRTRQRQRRKEHRVVGKRTTKLLTKDTHKGRAGKTKQNSSTGRTAPSTMQHRPPGSPGSIHMRSTTARRTKPVKDTGLKAHRPRALNPHPPRLYHILPVRRIVEHL